MKEKKKIYKALSGPRYNMVLLLFLLNYTPFYIYSMTGREKHTHPDDMLEVFCTRGRAEERRLDLL